jgi:hypothetical protein
MGKRLASYTLAVGFLLAGFGTTAPTAAPASPRAAWRRHRPRHPHRLPPRHHRQAPRVGCPLALTSS